MSCLNRAFSCFLLMNGCFLSGSLQVPLPPNPFDQLVLHPVVYRLPFGTHSHLLLRVPNFTNFILVSLQMLLKNLTVFICRFLVQSSCASGYILELSKLLLHVCILHSYTTTFSIPSGFNSYFFMKWLSNTCC